MTWRVRRSVAGMCRWEVDGCLGQLWSRMSVEISQLRGVGGISTGWLLGTECPGCYHRLQFFGLRLLVNTILYPWSQMNRRLS